MGFCMLQLLPSNASASTQLVQSPPPGTCIAPLRRSSSDRPCSGAIVARSVAEFTHGWKTSGGVSWGRRNGVRSEKRLRRMKKAFGSC